MSNCHRRIFFAFSALLLPASAAAQSPAAQPAALLQQAQEAMKDHLPEVATAKLQRLLSTAELPRETARQARLLLTESAVRAKMWDVAITAAQAPDVQASVDAAFWRAQANLGAGHFAEAERLLASLPENPQWKFATEAAFARSAALAALREFAGAIDVLAPLRSAADSAIAVKAGLWTVEFQLASGATADAAATLGGLKQGPKNLAAVRAFLAAKVDLAEGRLEQAESEFAGLATKQSGMTPALNHSAALGLARTQLERKDQAAALRTLSEFIQKHPDSPLLGAAFREFTRANVPPSPEMAKLLESWSGAESPALKAEAEFATAAALEAAGKQAEALKIYESSETRLTDTVHLARSMLLHSRLLIQLGKPADALTLMGTLKQRGVTAEVRAYASGLEGKANYDLREFQRAAGHFADAAGSATEEDIRAKSAFNAALCSLEAGSPADGMALLDALPASLAEGLKGELQLERGLYLAARGSPEADGHLKVFLDSHPNHPRRLQALVALAELALRQGLPAKEALDAALPLAEAESDRQRIEVLRLYETAQSGEEKFRPAAEAFLESHPDSAWKEELLMKLGESYFNAQQFTTAKARFQQLSDGAPESPLAEAALFWAGKSALGSLAKDCEMEAMKLWDSVAQGNGPLRLKARLEQAKLDQRRDPLAAVQLFDIILAADPPPDLEMRFMVLCLKGETLLAQNPSDPKMQNDAMACFDAVIGADSASALWKQQAWVRKAVCLENTKNESAALEAYNEAIGIMNQVRDAQESDYRWFFRAGEKAMRLLEARQNWNAAVAIAEKLAVAPGPLADAARERAKRLRIEHFLLDDE
jgi:outer membrane protein assembly factor BamD (BamD/ComL family)